MNHIEPDDLATLALEGGRPDGAARAHLDECVECRAEYEALARTVELGRRSGRDLEPPPSCVWAAIHGELALPPELAADPFAAPSLPRRQRSTADEPASSRSARPDPVTGRRDAVRRTRERRRRRWWPVAVAAAAAASWLGVAVGAALAGLGGAASQTVVATATLDAFPGWSTTGEAVVEQDDEGVRSIVVDLERRCPRATCARSG